MLAVRRLPVLSFAAGALSSAPLAVNCNVDAKYLEIDPSSPVLLAQLYDSLARQNAYMLAAGDVAKFDGRTPQVFIAPHANVPTPASVSLEGVTPLVRMLDDGDFRRGLQTPRPPFYRFQPVRAQAGPGATVIPFRFATPLWDAIALWITVTAVPVGTTIAIYGEHMDDAGAVVSTAILAPVALAAVNQKVWQTIGDAAVAAQNSPWVRVEFVAGIAGALDITVGAELWSTAH